MILWSLSAFWYPLAYKWQCKFTEAELKQKARNAIYQLQQQINYLAQIFGLDPQEFASPVAGSALKDSSTRRCDALELPVPAIPMHGVKPFSSAGIDTSTNPESASFAYVPDVATQVRSADDELLDEAFNSWTWISQVQ